MVSFLTVVLAVTCALPGAAKTKPPNFVFLLVDDLGFGDVDICPDTMPYEECPLRPKTEGRQEWLKTPRLKEMAAEGQIMTNWYSPRAICSPSRSAMLSGRDPVRYAGIDNFVRIYPASSARGGFPQEELTVAEYLKEQGYTTGYAGKWHIGVTDGKDPLAYTPMRQGFEEVYFFIGGSNGEPCSKGALNPPGDNNIYHMCSFSQVMDVTGEVIEQPVRWENVSGRALVETVNFIDRHASDAKPFFFQHAFTQVHVPWNPSRYFVSDEVNHVWTDMVSEVDWAVGVILDKIKEKGIEDNTIVVLASDNGPYMEFASSECPQNCKIQMPDFEGPEMFGCSPCDTNTVSLPGPLKGGKGNVWEGGVRTPGIWWWPKTIPAGSVNPTVTSQMDFLPTAVALASGSPFVPKGNRIYDGRDITDSLKNPPAAGSDPTGNFFYWCGTHVFAVRMGKYKVWFKSQDFVGKSPKDPVSKSYCAMTGECCMGSPSRLCTCQFATSHEDDPVVINLVTNIHEDFENKEDGAHVAGIIEEAREARYKLMTGVLQERCAMQPDACAHLDKMFPTVNSKARQLAPESREDKMVVMFKYLTALPDRMMVDMCVGGDNMTIDDKVPKIAKMLEDQCGRKPNEPFGCPLIPPQCQMKEFAPYDNCAIDGMGESCANRRPCGQQEGYCGPYEFVNPGIGGVGEKKCGAFKQPSGNSYFPEHFLQSVCDWQDRFPNVPWCRPKPCATAESDKKCQTIEKYGLNNIPTGEIWNAPFPDDQACKKPSDPCGAVVPADPCAPAAKYGLNKPNLDDKTGFGALPKPTTFMTGMVGILALFVVGCGARKLRARRQGDGMALGSQEDFEAVPAFE